MFVSGRVQAFWGWILCSSCSRLLYFAEEALGRRWNACKGQKWNAGKDYTTRQPVVPGCCFARDVHITSIIVVQNLQKSFSNKRDKDNQRSLILASQFPEKDPIHLWGFCSMFPSSTRHVTLRISFQICDPSVRHPAGGSLASDVFRRPCLYAGWQRGKAMCCLMTWGLFQILVPQWTIG